MDESKSDADARITFDDALSILLKIVQYIVWLLPAILIASYFYSLYSAEIKARDKEYAQYGCYPIEREYMVCGPVEGKPGFTRCETKTEKVCPDDK